MTNPHIAQQRLHNQLISQHKFEQPAEVVQWMGAVQAQDYAAALWALGLRSPQLTAIAIDQAFAEGAILRTHVMRPTWHLVSPSDIRWLLALTAPRVRAGNAYWDRKLELDDAAFQRCNDTLTRALQGGKQLTRPELASVLQQANLATDDLQRVTYLMMRAELDGIICSGARRGKQFTYALLDERAPQGKPFERDETLATFVARYFTSHGPATLQDFVWWSGLTLTDAKAGIEMVRSQLIYEVIDNQTYWFAPSTLPVQASSPTTYLLPNFDEYIVGYTDRSAIFDAPQTPMNARDNILFSHTIVMDGQVIGTWKRAIKKDCVLLTPTLLAELTASEMHTLNVAAEHYGAFLELPVQIRSE